jgi:hypothetical protein
MFIYTDRIQVCGYFAKWISNLSARQARGTGVLLSTMEEKRLNLILSTYIMDIKDSKT